MKYEIAPNSCRICLRKCNKLRSIYNPLDEGDEPPNEMLKLIAGVTVDEFTDAEELPKKICKGCLLSLNVAFHLRTQAIRSQKIIEIAYNDQRCLNVANDMKVEDLEIPFSDDAKIEYLDLDLYDNDCDETYSSADEEPLSNMQSQKRPFKNHGRIDELRKELNSLEKQFSAKVPIRNVKKNVEQSAGKSEKTLMELGAATTTKPLRKKSDKTRVNDENGHICDICGNIYAKRARMMEHRRSHDMELRFTCEICNKSFHLREKLRKHMYTHGGKKPFQCSYCSRTFFYESLKVAHEAVHSGVKPHVCKVCNKTFSYSQALKNHTLIHDAIKLFHCEYCDKDFRLKHHMQQHEETKLHQNAVKSIEAARSSVPI